MYGEFVIDDPVTVTEHVLEPDPAVKVQVGVGLNVTPEADEKVTVPVGAVGAPDVSVTVMVKLWEPPRKTVPEVGLHEVAVARFGVSVKFRLAAVLPFDTEMPASVCDRKSGCDAVMLTVALFPL